MDKTVCSQLATSLDTIVNSGEEKFTTAILRLLFSHIENIHISPVWWGSLNNEQQTYLIKRMAHFSDGYLLDDGLLFEPWAIRKRVYFKE